MNAPHALQEAEWLFGIPAADALAHPERVLEQGAGWRGVLVSGALCWGWKGGATPRLAGAGVPVHSARSGHAWLCISSPLPCPATRRPCAAAGEKGSGYAFRGPGGKAAMSGVVPVLGVEVVDTTGAGDAYLAGRWSGAGCEGSGRAMLAPEVVDTMGPWHAGQGGCFPGLAGWRRGGGHRRNQTCAV